MVAVKIDEEVEGSMMKKRGEQGSEREMCIEARGPWG